MKTFLVCEVVKTRHFDSSLMRNWSKWKVEEDEFDKVVEKVKEDSTKNPWIDIQIAKFYYDENNNFVAWDCGVTITNGKEWD